MANGSDIFDGLGNVRNPNRQTVMTKFTKQGNPASLSGDLGSGDDNDYVSWDPKLLGPKDGFHDPIVEPPDRNQDLTQKDGARYGYPAPRFAQKEYDKGVENWEDLK